ncbi:MAG: ATP-dependent DNA helicase RecG [Patescibacteria group bacterium]
MTHLDAPISQLGAWGARYKNILKKRGIATCRDLLHFFPYRIDDFSTSIPIADIRPGMQVTLSGTIQLIGNRRSPRTRKIITEALISDASGSIKAIWFNQPFLSKNLKSGDAVYLAGKASDQYLDLQLISPAYEKISSEHEAIHTGRCVPIYSLGESASQKVFRSLVKQVLDRYLPTIEEWIPLVILQREGLMGYSDALREIHFPSNLSTWDAARQRLKFDELLLLQLISLQSRKNHSLAVAPRISVTIDLQNTFITSLPFSLTASQQKALDEILGDMQRESPMNRLLEGDVGSGKTVVAAAALLHCATSGYQAVCMTPTELLARQHFETLCGLIGGFGMRIALLTSHYAASNRQSCDASMSDSRRKKALTQSIVLGEIDIIIGTHALLEEDACFKKIGLIVIDEQHRFGTRQRQYLRDKNMAECMPHLLLMTATPIPRSLALTVFGDLDLSIIDQMPPGRKKVITKCVPARYREWTYTFVKKMISLGRQAFILCPLIDPSDSLGIRSVTQEYKRLKDSTFRDCALGFIHGKMHSDKKEKVMRDFSEGRISILVATSIIEVGIDIPNATIMMIEGAERFGLAQLHQFRGRIGRSSHQAYCFLLPTDESKQETQRLKVMVSCSDGFALAEEDLKLRGSGELYGYRQSGLPDLKIASLADYGLIQKARQAAQEMIDDIDAYPHVLHQLNEYQKEIRLE